MQCTSGKPLDLRGLRRMGGSTRALVLQSLLAWPEEINGGMCPSVPAPRLVLAVKMPCAATLSCIPQRKSQLMTVFFGTCFCLFRVPKAQSMAEACSLCTHRLHAQLRTWALPGFLCEADGCSPPLSRALCKEYLQQTIIRVGDHCPGTSVFKC